MIWNVLRDDVMTYLRGNQWMVQNGFIPKVHAVLCDPPYALPGGFMSKDWDNFNTPQAYQAWVSEWAGLLIDYVYPGAVGLFFGGTRTYHRLATGLEDAGWEITDCMMWVQGQGFPKSAAIDKLLDKEAGAAREVVGVGTSGKNRNVLNAALHPETFGGPFALTAPATPLAARWEGYGTALKPAYETVVVCRAPRGKRTYAALAREFGTGALNVDGSRIGTSVDDPNVRVNTSIDRNGGVWGNGAQTHRAPTLQQGRWPANFGLVCACEGDDHADDCPVSVLGRQSGEGTPTLRKNKDAFVKVGYNGGLKGRDEGFQRENVGYEDRGSAARFFYQAKAAAWEREAGLHDRTRKIGGGKTMLRPRADLTPEKRAWLEAELERRGIA